MSVKCLKRKMALIEKIHVGATGNAEQLAKHLDTSKRTISRDLEELKDLGIDICYCRIRKTYNFCTTINKQEILQLLIK